MNVVGRTVIVIKLITASRLVNKPVFKLKTETNAQRFARSRSCFDQTAKSVLLT